MCSPSRHPERVAHDRSLLGTLEIFVVAELQRPAACHDERLRFSYYRDKGQLEVDVVLENEAGEMVGIEVKAAATVTAGDFKGLRKLAELSAKTLRAGVVLHDGDQSTPFGDNLLFAAPVAALWAP
ncbi:DUF4143 domain-containing protein [Phenylobacterium sp.]|uniref:DUF4143 domain-containing protein n=1 Tax=Phenylobacterium sp. TaxID=1871053 RepID=UPI0035C80958